MTGVDRSRAYLDEARQREGAVEWIESDMREFERPASFDAVANLWSSFGYFERIEDDLRAAKAARACLRPGGALLIDLKGKEIVARHFTPRSWHTLEDGSELLVELIIEDGWQRLEQRWTLMRGFKRIKHRIRLRLYSGAELKALLLAAGFTEVKLYGDFDGREYGPEASRLVAVAR
ncbi:MAG: class I SAM-dependent methyltransferase [Planctomycetes bacterium]|nr:class I SAM-dependent methyltransferase [Planctomycetota bacterium]